MLSPIGLTPKAPPPISHPDKYTFLVYSQQYALEAKYFIPKGPVNWLTNPIPTPDDF